MLKSLSYSVSFPATGRSLTGAFEFEKGSYAITGPNESGKSFAIEMVRFCLFGSAALRGKADDYKGLTATLSLALKGASYTITRTLTSARIESEGATLAVGVRPTNAKVLSILGFDLNVFDVSCCANQSDITRFGDLGSAERKRLVDDVIGLSKIDAIVKWASEQRLLLGREVEVLERGLVEPAQPTPPADYRLSADLQSKVLTLRAQKSEFDQLIGWLAHDRAAPAQPEPPAVLDRTENDLEAELEAIDAAAAERRHIERLPIVDFDVNEVRAAWAAWDLWKEQQRFENAHPRPSLTREEIALDRERHARHDLEQSLRQQHARALQSLETDCPNCGHHFHLDHIKIGELEAKIAELGKTSAPLWNPLRWELEERRLADWDNPATITDWERLKDVAPAERPLVARERLKDAVEGITPAERARRLDELPRGRDRGVVAGELQSLREHRVRCDRYVTDLEQYEAWKTERDVKRARAEELAPGVGALPDVERRLNEARLYEQQLLAFEKARADYDARTTEVAGKKIEVEAWKQAGAILAEVRTRVKTYLVPSLSKVASHLLSQMTAGQRSSIVVDENFEIMVDGQRLDTLSGSGKACANLALRIGLGQVLTNNVLSLFIGDEIDASMDEDRAASTQDSLGSLTQSISQIILVTHKIPQANKVIRLGG
jgi:exonuclease SbcC